jgi:hypothetical protein
MCGSNSLQTIMLTPLPPIEYQRKLSYRPSLEEVYTAYDLINLHVFDNKLIRPEIRIGRRRGVLGWCWSYIRPRKTGSTCIILLTHKWCCIQWLYSILAHEMVHQYQSDIDRKDRALLGKGMLMKHGPNFFIHRNKLAQSGIILKTSYGLHHWLVYQDFKKC